MTVDLRALPDPVSDLVMDAEGFSVELSVQRELTGAEASSFERAAIGMPPVLSMAGHREIRGLVSVEDDTLFVYVHELGPGPYDQAAADAARAALVTLWDDAHRAAGAA
jgi:hypothetical protein